MAEENEKKSLSTLTIEMDGTDYVMQGGGGIKPGVPIPPDTVDSAAIIDGAVEMQDLSPEIEASDDDIDDIFDE
jgi:hypothetical protein